MAWKNMPGGWTQNATQGFKTRALLPSCARLGQLKSTTGTRICQNG